MDSKKIDSLARYKVTERNLNKDRDGYSYEYDYENRIVKILDDADNTVARFAYDTMGRRIRKSDCIADTNTLYYYNDNWQVLSEYDGSFSLNLKRIFIYGNYIDEVLVMGTADGGPIDLFYYVNDHLYSPAALIADNGYVQERYEYDAYGQPTIMDASYNPRAGSLYDNPYYFTGRRLDFLDNGKLKLQINRHRYYDYYTGRWLTQDPVGIMLDRNNLSGFCPLCQYEDTLNLYVGYHIKNGFKNY